MNRELLPFCIIAVINMLIVLTGYEGLSTFIQPLQVPSLVIPYFFLGRRYNYWFLFSMLLFWATDLLILNKEHSFLTIILVLAGIGHLVYVKFALEGIKKLRFKRLLRSTFPLIFLYVLYFGYSVLDMISPVVTADIYVYAFYAAVLGVFLCIAVLRFFNNTGQASLWLVIIAISAIASDTAIAFDLFFFEMEFFKVVGVLAECVSYFFMLRYVLDFKTKRVVNSELPA